MGTKSGEVFLRLFGGLEVCRGGATHALPQSKKTRALLAFLAATGRRQRRERLCEMFWDIPDDPRGALRWSLSKLRPLVDAPDAPRIVADRETVALDLDDDAVDLRAAKAAVSRGLDSVSTVDLTAVADTIKGEFMAGLDLPNLDGYQAWLTAEREDARDLQMTVFTAAAERLNARPKEALVYARCATSLDPEDENARALVARLQNSKTRKSSAGSNSSAEESPNLPTLAVLPFENMSGDPSDEYLSDGVTEDLITELSRFRWMRVIARNSSFTYKGRAARAQDVGRDLRVGYMVEGSVRRTGDRVRATAQLIDTRDGAHCWAERYDRTLEDIFALQEDIARTVAAALEPELGLAEQERSRKKPVANLNAWDWHQRGVWHVHKDTESDDVEAVRNFERAIELSPDFAPPHAAKAFALFQLILNGHRKPTDAAINKACAFAERAIALDDKDAFAHMTLGRLRLLQRRHHESIAELETAISLNPSFADAFHGLGFTLIFAGRPADAVPQFEAAARLSPHDPRLSSFYELKAEALFFEGRYEEALDAARFSVRQPNASHWAFATLAAILGYTDQLEEASRAWAETQKRKPEFSAAFVRQVIYYSNEPVFIEKFIEGLRRAGGQ